MLSNYLNIQNALLSLLTAIVVRGVVTSIGIAESFIAVTIIGYMGYLKHLDHNKAKKIEKDTEERIKSLESKMSFLNINKR